MMRSIFSKYGKKTPVLVENLGVLSKQDMGEAVEYVRKYWPEEFLKFLKYFNDGKTVNLSIICKDDFPRCKSPKVVSAEELKVHEARLAEVEESEEKAPAGKDPKAKAPVEKISLKKPAVVKKVAELQRRKLLRRRRKRLKRLRFQSRTKGAIENPKSKTGAKKSSGEGCCEKVVGS